MCGAATVHIKMKVAAFTEQYLERDEDDFMVLKTAPCSFLDESDNTCFIYDVRPKACSEYPHSLPKYPYGCALDACRLL